jgi:Rieske Fe-S protein
MSIAPLTRRTALGGALVAVVGGVAGWLTVRATGAAGGSGATAGNAYRTSAGRTAQPLIPLARLPAGGSVVLSDARVVLTRDTAGKVHAFSAVCTHQGCTVALSGGVLQCPCHGSRFAAATGAVLQGPAARPLPPIAVVVRNGGVYRS